MNKMEKIVAESRTQKEAVAKVVAMRDAAATFAETMPSEMEIAQAVKDIKNGRTTMVATNVQGTILTATKKLELGRQREYLESHNPHGLIAKAIAKLDEGLAAEFEKAKADPFHTLSWGGKLFEMAARRKAYLEISNDMDRCPLGPESWKAILSRVQSEALRMAGQSGSSRSTSRCSNLAEDCLMEAKARIANGDDWEIREITWWFKEKEKFDREWAEVYGQ